MIDSDTAFLAVITSSNFNQRLALYEKYVAKALTTPFRKNSISSHPEEGFNLLFVILKEVIYDFSD